MTNAEIARPLREAAALIELTGGNPYRARAFERAARTLAGLDDDEDSAAGRARRGTLTDLDGVGEAMAGHVEAVLERGSFAQRDELLAEVPPGLPEVLRVKGLGTKKVRRLWQDLGVTSLDELEAAAAEGRIAELSGFGKKAQANVLENTRLVQHYRTRRRYADALRLAEPLLDALRNTDGIARAEPAGALRRRRETLERVELIAAGEPHAAEDALAPWLSSDGERLVGDELSFEGTFEDDFPFAVRLVPEEPFGTQWWLMTGSEAHCSAFRERFGQPEEVHASEERLYEAAGLPFIAPELREGRGEIEAAAEDALPDLIEAGDLRGVLHNHSTYSDGTHTLRRMAEAARARGLAYFGICDHSQSLGVANGLTPDDVARQQEEIRALNDEFASDDGNDGGDPFRVFSGIESDILSDGSLDYDEDVLASFDLVVASVHQGLDMTEAEATERVVRAVQNPHTTILGHATGRQLLAREGYPLDVGRVIEACAEHGVAIEFNANPRRLDLDWRHLRAATDAGVLISINPDAHATGELDYMTSVGLPIARKGWLTAVQCLNARPLEDFAAWIGA